MTTTQKTASNRSSGKAHDAIAMLIADHDNVKRLFKSFEKAKEDEVDDDEKQQLVQEICAELTIHAQLEEEIFYPAARDAIDDEDLIDEAEVEHASAKDLIAQLEDMDPGDELYDAKVTVLGEYIDHHVKEEQDEMFPKVRKAKIDLEELATEMQARKDELLAS